MALRITNVTIDCESPDILAAFWASALGYEQRTWSAEDRETIEADHPEWIGAQAVIAPPQGTDGLRIFFQRVPERKQVKNRVHLDLAADDATAEIERLISLGASSVQRVEVPLGDAGVDAWTIMRDPEDNEFCVS